MTGDGHSACRSARAVALPSSPSAGGEAAVDQQRRAVDERGRVLDLKTWLFCGHDPSARRAADALTIITTCKKFGHEAADERWTGGDRFDVLRDFVAIGVRIAA
jgi:hypothetical protein